MAGSGAQTLLALAARGKSAENKQYERRTPTSHRCWKADARSRRGPVKTRARCQLSAQELGFRASSGVELADRTDRHRFSIQERPRHAGAIRGRDPAADSGIAHSCSQNRRSRWSSETGSGRSGFPAARYSARSQRAGHAGSNCGRARTRDLRYEHL